MADAFEPVERSLFQVIRVIAWTTFSRTAAAAATTLLPPGLNNEDHHSDHDHCQRRPCLPVLHLAPIKERCDLKHNQRRDPCENRHEKKLTNGPFPRTRLASHDGRSRQALQSVDVKDQQ